MMGSAPLHCREEGSGPALLLLHGMGSDHTIWNGVVPELAEHYRVIAPDLRGHGRSPAPPAGALSFSEMRSDLIALLDSRGISSAHVVAMSAGGYLAIDLALEQPARVASLFLIGSGAHADAHTRAVVERWREVAETEGSDAFALRLAKDLLSAEWLEHHLDYLDQMRKEARAHPFRGAALWGPALRTFDRRGQIGRIKCPTFLLHGMDDAVVDASHPRLVRQTILGAEIRLIPGAGHLLPVERARETAQEIRAFLTKQGVTGSAPGKVS
jgi:3-oxoadipate enol-lactonase